MVKLDAFRWGPFNLFTLTWICNATSVEEAVQELFSCKATSVVEAVREEVPAIVLAVEEVVQ